jgi:hypothetical protein
MTRRYQTPGEMTKKNWVDNKPILGVTQACRISKIKSPDSKDDTNDMNPTYRNRFCEGDGDGIEEIF